MAISHDRSWAVGATAGLEPLDAGQLPRAERAMRTWPWPWPWQQPPAEPAIGATAELEPLDAGLDLGKAGPGAWA